MLEAWLQVPPPKTAAEVPGPVPGILMTKEYVQMVGRMAYVYSAISFPFSLPKRKGPHEGA